MALNCVVIFGSVRSGRRGIRAVRLVERLLGARGHRLAVVDPVEVRLPLLDKMYKEYPKGAAPEALERLAGLYREADVFVIVTGEYNHTMPPGLMNLLDHFLEEYFWRPSAIVSYSGGGFGGVRAAVQLRASLCELGMPSIPTAFAIPRVQETLTEDGRPTDDGGLERRFARFAGELEWYAEALRARRAGGVPY